jgi:carotenoid cleavage dioxygenase-like enzyme
MVVDMSRTEIESRIAEINLEEKEMAERQYRYGYMVDRQYSAKLFQEKMQLMKQLKAL